VLGLAPGAGCEAFLTTNKAKAIAYMLVFNQTNSTQLWLDLDPGRAETVARHLDHYLISERVEILDQTLEYAQLYLAGPQAPTVLSSTLSPSVEPLPMCEVPVSLFGDDRFWIRRRDLLPWLPGFDIICPTKFASEVWQRLRSSGAFPAGSLTYDTLRIEAGIPVFGKDIDEERMVVEVGRGELAINYKKGCYLGQETIVMARDRGHVNRFLVGFQIEEEQPELAGSRLYRSGQEVGQITSACNSPRCGCIGLGYVRRGFQEPGTELELDAQRKVLTASLPFPSERKAR
jgi:folate-binding protein YgfZ